MHRGDGDPGLVIQAASVHLQAYGNSDRSWPPGRSLASRKGSKSQPDLRSPPLQSQPLSASSMSSSALPPVALRRVSSMSADSSGPAAAEMAAVVLQRHDKKARPISGGSSVSVYTDDDDVSRWTASSCSSVRVRPESVQSYTSNRSSRGQLRGGPGGFNAQRKRGRTRRESTYSNDAVCCPRGHELLNVDRHKGWFCHGCGRVSSQTKMECYRCNRCNYNLCDQCHAAQTSENYSDHSPLPPPLFSRTGTSVASAARSIDDLFTHRTDDGRLPHLPPAFCRGLSPESRSPSATRSRPDSGKRSKRHMSKSPPPHKRDIATASTRVSTKPSSRRSSDAFSTGSSFYTFTDPLLRIVPLTEWAYDHGYVEDELEQEPKRPEDIADIQFIDAAFPLTIQGQAMTLDRVAPGDRHRRIDKAYLEELRKMATEGVLPPEDVAEDLKIWHLTLLRRPARKKCLDKWGRVDPRFKAKLEESEPEPLRSRNRRRVSQASSEQLAESSMTPEVNQFSSQSAKFIRQPISGDGAKPSHSTPVSQSGSFKHTGSGFSTKSVTDTKFPNVQHGTTSDVDGPTSEISAGNQSGKGLGSKEGGKQSHRSSLSQEAHSEVEEELGSTAESSALLDSLRPDSPASRSGKSDAASLSANTEINEDQPGRSGQQAGGQTKASSQPTANASSAAQQAQGASSPDEDGQKEEEEESPGEGQLEDFQPGKLFRVKASAEEMVDEFVRMLLPPPPSSMELLASLQGTPDGSGHASGHGSAKEDGESQDGSHRSEQILNRGTQGPPPVIWSPGLRSSLAEDFKTAIDEAWQKIEGQDASREEVPKTMNSLHKRTSAMLPVRDARRVQGAFLDNLFQGSSMPDLQNEPTLLETHLRLRAERHARQLQHRTTRSIKSADPWGRRQKVCQQSLNSLDALSMFAELQRKQLATA